MDTVAHNPEATTDRQQEMIARHAQVLVSPLESSPSAP